MAESSCTKAPDSLVGDATTPDMTPEPVAGSPGEVNGPEWLASPNVSPTGPARDPNAGWVRAFRPMRAGTHPGWLRGCGKHGHGIVAGNAGRGRRIGVEGTRDESRDLS